MGKEKQTDILQDYLKSGEHVLWHGWAEPCAFLEGKDKKRILRNWAIECGIEIAFVAFCVSMAEEVNYKFLLGTLVILAVALCSPYMEWRKLKNQQYWVTNQRIITGRGAGNLSSIDLELVDEVAVRKLSTGHDCVLLCSKIVAEGEKQLRWRSSSPVEGREPGEVGMVFYNVARAQEAVDAIRSVKGDI